MENVHLNPASLQFLSLSRYTAGVQWKVFHFFFIGDGSSSLRAALIIASSSWVVGVNLVNCNDINVKF